MSIRIKAIVIIGLILVVALLVQYYVANRILLASFSNLEKREVQEDVWRAANVVADQLNTMEKTVKDWAYWDDTYLFMQYQNDDYVSDNLTFDTMANLDLDLMIFVNTDASIRYATAVDLASGGDAPFPEPLRNYIFPQSQILPSLENRATIKGLIEVESQNYMLITAAPILTNDATGPSDGTLIFGRYLNERRIAQLTQTTRLDFTFMPTNTPQAKESGASFSLPFELNTPKVTALSSEVNVGLLGLSDIFGEPAVVLELHSARDIYQRGRETFLILFGIEIIIGLLTALATLFLLEKAVLARLSHLSDAVGAITEVDTVTIHVSGNDEISKLGQVISTMLGGLRDSRAKLHHANLTLEAKVVERTQQLEHSIKHTEAILDSSSDALITTNDDGNITQINPAFTSLFGYTDAEAKTLYIWDIVTQESHDVLREQIQRTVRNRKSRRVDVTAKRNDGTTFNADIALSVLILADDSVFGGIASIRDTSLQKQIEDNLREALAKERELRDLKTRFISMASHEFRTPLAIIQASADIQHHYNDKLTEAQKGEHYDKIVHQIGHMTDLLNQVLKMNRDDFGGLDYKPVPTNLDALCREIVDDFKLATNATHGQKYSCLGQCAPVMADPTLIRHAISNLLSNGIKYSPEGSVIDLKLMFEDNHVVITIADKGIGIPQRDRKYLFQPFHRAQNVGTIPGTGLGLSITKQAIELHGGSISYESEEGIGTTFRITLPYTQRKEVFA